MKATQVRALLVLGAAVAGVLAAFFPSYMVPLTNVATFLSGWAVRAPGDAPALPKAEP